MKLSYKQAHDVYAHVSENLEVIKHQSLDETLLGIETCTGNQLSKHQLRDILRDLDVEVGPSIEDIQMAVVGVCARMGWTLAQMATEGRNHLKRATERRAAEEAKEQDANEVRTSLPLETK